MADNAVHHSDVRHETSDANIQGILRFGAGLLALGVFTWIAMTLLYNFFHSREVEAKRSRFPLAKKELPPEPRLEEVDRQSAGALKKKMVPSTPDELKEYQWIDRDKGIVQIPIERAMKMLTEPGKLKADAGMKFSTIPSDSSSGRGKP